MGVKGAHGQYAGSLSNPHVPVSLHLAFWHPSPESIASHTPSYGAPATISQPVVPGVNAGVRLHEYTPHCRFDSSALHSAFATSGAGTLQPSGYVVPPGYPETPSASAHTAIAHSPYFALQSRHRGHHILRVGDRLCLGPIVTRSPRC